MSAALTCAGRLCARSFLRKPRSVYEAENKKAVLERSLTLFDLLAIGVGGTVGSGVFVLTGVIVHTYAGPAAVLSWLIAGICCILSALSYAELSCRMSSAGSSYAYSFHSLGELPAVIAAWCLSLEYGISGAAVARSWGEKLGLWLNSVGISIPWFLNPDCGFSIFGALLQLACTALLAVGVEVGQLTINAFTVLKVILVIFIIIAGLAYFEPKNLTPFAPFGVTGVMKGTMSAFFGYVGYDEVCCMAAEAKNPKEILPLAVMGTVATVSILYVLASLALVGMIPYGELSNESGFSSGFGYVGNIWAQQLVAIGELTTLPVVVLVSFLAQPRLQFAMAADGLMPKLFAVVDTNGNLLSSIIITGLVCSLIAFLVPFSNLNDMISAGVLISFNMTNTALIFLRQEDRNRMASDFELISPIFSKFLTKKTALRDILILFHILSVIFAFTVANSNLDAAFIFLLIIICGALFFLSFCLYTLVSSPASFEMDVSTHYVVPYVPFTPLLGIFVNYCLIAQLSSTGLILITTYILCAVFFYYSFGYTYSIGNNSGWKDLLESSNFSFSNNVDEDAEFEFSPPSSSYQMSSTSSDLIDKSNDHTGFYPVTIGAANTGVSPRYTAVRTSTITNTNHECVSENGTETDTEDNSQQQSIFYNNPIHRSTTSSAETI